MKYFIDAEFLEDGVTIEPISLAVVAEDSRELYLELQFDETRARAHPFVNEFVLPHLRNSIRVSREEARDALLLFLPPDECLAAVGSEIEFWAWYGSYDWVLICQLFGPMASLPPTFPKFIRDMRQVIDDEEARKLVRLPPEAQHDALADARWLREVFVAKEATDRRKQLEADAERRGSGLGSYWLERARELTAELAEAERKRSDLYRRAVDAERALALRVEGSDQTTATLVGPYNEAHTVAVTVDPTGSVSITWTKKKEPA